MVNHLLLLIYPQLQHHCCPYVDCMTKGAFKWTKAATKMFENTKDKMKEVPIVLQA